MRYLSLFSGMGGIDLGLDQAGMECAAQCENNWQARKVLRRHWPNVLCHANVLTLEGNRYRGTVDLVAGGFPCQDLSVAGKRVGLVGARSGLFWQVMRIVDEVAPRWVLLENVPGLLNSNGGRDMATVVGALAERGYGWAYRVLDGQYFGVAQRRRRVFIVGCLGDAACAATVLFEQESCGRDSPPQRTPRHNVAGTLAAGAHPSGFNGRDAERGMLIPDVAHSLTTRSGQRMEPTSDTYVTYSIRGTLADGRSAERGGPDGLGVTETISWTLNATEVHAGAFDWQSGGDVRLNISEEHISALQTQQTPAVMQSNMQVRRLTPTECLRLQGFPDDYFNGLTLSDSAKYHLCGNAVIPAIAQWIGKRIIAAS